MEIEYIAHPGEPQGQKRHVMLTCRLRFVNKNTLKHQLLGSAAGHDKTMLTLAPKVTH